MTVQNNEARVSVEALIIYESAEAMGLHFDFVEREIVLTWKIELHDRAHVGIIEL